MNAHQRRKRRRAQLCPTLNCDGRGPLFSMDFGHGIVTMPMCRRCMDSFVPGPIYTLKLTLPSADHPGELRELPR